MLRVELISPPDREELVAALLVDHSQFAEVRIEGGVSKIELYGSPDGSAWDLDLTELLSALSHANERLRSRALRLD